MAHSDTESDHETDRDYGRLIAYMTPNYQPGSKSPAFKGTISLLAESEKRSIALWPHVSSNTGKTFLTGRAAANAADQIDALTNPVKDEDVIKQALSTGSQFAVDANEIVLFKNQHKSPEHPNRPDYYGYFNPGNGEDLRRLDVWAKPDKFGKAMLSGPVKPNSQSKTQEQDQNHNIEDADDTPRRSRRR